MGCPGNHRGNGAKHSGDEALQFQDDAHIARELQQSQRGGLAMSSSCSLIPRLITRGGCRQVFGLLVCSCLEGYGENPAPENIFPWKTKGRNIYTIFVALSCLPPLTLITASWQVGPASTSSKWQARWMGRLPDQLMHLCGGNVAAHQFYVYELGSGRTRATNLKKYSALAEQCVDGCRCLCDSNAQHTNAERLFSCSSFSEKNLGEQKANIN